MTQAERPVGELFQEFSQQTSTLIRQELELARLELTEKGKQTGIGLGMFGGAGALGLYALGALTAAVILLLATAMKPWLGALIVAVAWAAIAGVLALMGRRKVQQGAPPVPAQAAESVKEDVRVTRNRARQARG
jgi:uncharacterized membrane protein YqjE